eukprot:NODE_5607_length_1753_cov_3.682657.p1 GENE.NODE_5607_length_1753_cov_3.682657~~NODE_5607_length_1753_cov_3.682657.p1  ORF type:complete len:327 (+),score=80.44 NODE_5607_length_1753_cov_3.682657:133-981(+)
MAPVPAQLQAAGAVGGQAAAIVAGPPEAAAIVAEASSVQDRGVPPIGEDVATAQMSCSPAIRVVRSVRCMDVAVAAPFSTIAGLAQLLDGTTGQPRRGLAVIGVQPPPTPEEIDASACPVAAVAAEQEGAGDEAVRLAQRDETASAPAAGQEEMAAEMLEYKPGSVLDVRCRDSVPTRGGAMAPVPAELQAGKVPVEVARAGGGVAASTATAKELEGLVADPRTIRAVRSMDVACASSYSAVADLATPLNSSSLRSRRARASTGEFAEQLEREAAEARAVLT